MLSVSDSRGQAIALAKSLGLWYTKRYRSGEHAEMSVRSHVCSESVESLEVGVLPVTRAPVAARRTAAVCWTRSVPPRQSRLLTHRQSQRCATTAHTCSYIQDLYAYTLACTLAITSRGRETALWPVRNNHSRKFKGATCTADTVPVQSSGPPSHETQETPIIGILSQPLGPLHPEMDGYTYFPASYAQYAAMSGARVVAVLCDTPEPELRKLYESINGLVVPGVCACKQLQLALAMLLTAVAGCNLHDAGFFYDAMPSAGCCRSVH